MRVVRTPSGARFYGQPIGTVIQEDVELPSAREVGAWLRERNPGVDISVHQSAAGHLVLHMIRVPKTERGKGKARAALADLVAVADMLGSRVSLTPESPEDERSSKARLTALYREFGFVPNKGRHKDYTVSEAMYRDPQAQPDEEPTDRSTWTEDEQDLADELERVGAELHDDATVTLYHHTTPGAAAEIRRTGKLVGDEDGVFFTTKRDQESQAAGRGGAIITVRVPLNQLLVDDIFDDEAHLRIPTKRPGDAVAIASWLEKKGVRRVRTAEGARKYGQAIGEIIRVDIAQGLGPDDIEVGAQIGGGRVATTHRFKTPDGKKGIRKVMSDDNITGIPAQHQADAEYLVSLAAAAVGALAPQVYQVERDDLEGIDLDKLDDPDASHQTQAEIWMNEVPDAIVSAGTGNPDWLSVDKRYEATQEQGRGEWVIVDRYTRRPVPGRPFHEKWQADREALKIQEAERRRRSDAEDDDARLMGLLDLIVYNSDRNAGNWMLAAEDSGDPENPTIRKVGIDHGAAFADRTGTGSYPLGAGEIGGVRWPRVVGWFSEHFYAPRAEDDLTSGQRTLNPENDMSPADMALIKRALKALRTEFIMLGRQDWYSDMMRRFELLEARAAGTRNRLRDGDEPDEVERKALRRVRTPEGAQRYGQSIGEIIRADITQIIQRLVDENTGYGSDHRAPGQRSLRDARLILRSFGGS